MIGIFGGVFDPVHRGHISLAQTVSDHFRLRRIIFVPVGVPPHRSRPAASAQSRVKMLRAAISGRPGFEVSTVEVEKTSPSWTVRTLEHFTDEMPGETLCLLLGSDAFKQINQWYRWQSLLDYGHLIIVSRTGDELALEAEVSGFLEQHRATSLPDETGDDDGRICWLRADIANVSSTGVRRCIEANRPLAELLPAVVENLIKENGYYGYQ